MDNKRVKVLYIAGSGRSGSTILGKILGQAEGFFFAGELCKVWRYGFMENRTCGCGRPFKSCPFWNRIIYDAYGGMDKVDGRKIYGLRQKSAYMRHIPLMMAPGFKKKPTSNQKQFSEILEKLYLAIQHKTQCRVIVDCSKTAPYGYLLDNMGSLDMHIVHLIRDPRGVADAKLQKKLYQPDDGKAVYTGQSGILRSAAYWSVQNMATEMFWGKITDRYVRIQYEEFAAAPRETVWKIIAAANESPAGIDFIDKKSVSLDPITHTAAGNPVRFDKGAVEIKPDVEWSTRLSKNKQNAIEILTWPLFRRYGYHKG